MSSIKLLVALLLVLGVATGLIAYLVGKTQAAVMDKQAVLAKLTAQGNDLNTANTAIQLAWANADLDHKRLDELVHAYDIVSGLSPKAAAVLLPKLDAKLRAICPQFRKDIHALQALIPVVKKKYEAAAQTLAEVDRDPAGFASIDRGFQIMMARNQIVNVPYSLQGMQGDLKRMNRELKEYQNISSPPVPVK